MITANATPHGKARRTDWLVIWHPPKTIILFILMNRSSHQQYDLRSFHIDAAVLTRMDRRGYAIAVKHRVSGIALLAAIAIVIAGFALVRTTSDRASVATQGAASRPAAGSPPGRLPAAGSAAKPPPAHVTRLASPAERKEVADRIASARATRVRQAPTPPPSLPGAAQDESHDLERTSAQLKTALAEAIPFLAECYKTAPITQRRPAVQMTLTGDRDVGTLIDAEQLRDQDGKPLDPELDSCLRTTLGSLELPPLDMADPLHIQYSFVLDDD